MKQAKAFQFEAEPATGAPAVTVFVCGRQKRVDCKSCGAAAFRTCSFPVKRDGKPAQCERATCARCLETVDGVECCPAHARVMRGRKP